MPLTGTSISALPLCITGAKAVVRITGTDVLYVLGSFALFRCNVEFDGIEYISSASPGDQLVKFGGCAVLVSDRGSVHYGAAGCLEVRDKDGIADILAVVRAPCEARVHTARIKVDANARLVLTRDGSVLATDPMPVFTRHRGSTLVFDGARTRFGVEVFVPDPVDNAVHVVTFMEADAPPAPKRRKIGAGTGPDDAVVISDSDEE